jgi:putative ABC transport system permease protein
VSQLSLALVLLIGAGLLVRSFWLLRSEPTGFDPERVLTLRLSLPASRYESVAAQEAFLRRLDEGLRAGSGSESAGLISELPLGGWRMMHNMIVEGQPPVPEGQEPEVYTHEISPGYFSTMRMPLVLGRGFSDLDATASHLVGVVNEAFVRRFAPDRNPLGLRARWARGRPDSWISVVGVVGDVRFEALHERQEPTLYTPYAQKQQPWKRWTAVVARGEPALLADGVRRLVGRLDPRLPISDLKPMTDVMQDSVRDRRFNLVLISTFAALAFTLAALGVYGVLAYLVAQRSREVGVRMALGARRSDVLWLMLRQGLPLVACGIACGVLGALCVTRVLRSLLYGISPTDPLTFVIAVAGLALAGSLAAFIPARSATRVDPCVTLRAE